MRTGHCGQRRHGHNPAPQQTRIYGIHSMIR